MADKGLVTKSTLQGFADEIRRLAGTDQTGTPSEMLALLQDFVPTGAEVVYGTHTTSSDETTVTLNVALPEKSNYIFLMFHNSTSYVWNYGGTIISFAFIKEGSVVKSLTGETTSYNRNLSSFNMNTQRSFKVSNFANGTVTALSEWPSDREYYWLYIGW